MEGPLTLLAALLVGLAGAGHCAGMCGGIAGVLHQRGGRRAYWNQVGRVLGYATLGAAAGALAHGVQLGTGWQVGSGILKLVLGLVIVLMGVQMLTGRRFFVALEKLGLGFWRRLAPLTGRLVIDGGPASGLGLGLLWAALPCGMIYAMLGAAAASGHPLEGAALMTAFGLGTLPATVAGGTVLARMGRHPGGRRAAGTIVTASGTVLIVMAAAGLFSGPGHVHGM